MNGERTIFSGLNSATLISIFFSELLLLVNLSVALANAYITPLPLSPDEVRSVSINEVTAPTPAPTVTVKKGAKVDPAAVQTSQPSTANPAKTEDAKTALDVSCSLVQNRFVISVLS